MCTVDAPAFITNLGVAVTLVTRGRLAKQVRALFPDYHFPKKNSGYVRFLILVCKSIIMT